MADVSVGFSMWVRGGGGHDIHIRLGTRGTCNLLYPPPIGLTGRPTEIKNIFPTVGNL